MDGGTGEGRKEDRGCMEGFQGLWSPLEHTDHAGGLVSVAPGTPRCQVLMGLFILGRFWEWPAAHCPRSRGPEADSLGRPCQAHSGPGVLNHPCSADRSGCGWQDPGHGGTHQA